MAVGAPGWLVAALLVLLAPAGALLDRGLDDESALVQVGSAAAHAEAAAEMVSGMLSMLKGMGGGRGRWGAKKDSIMNGPAGCVWSRDLKASWEHMSQLLPTVEHGMLNAMLPKMVAMAKVDGNAEAPSAEEKEASKTAMMNQMMEVMAPLKDELMPPECDNGLIKKKVMSQSLAGGGEAEEITAKCLVKATHVTPACARCAGNFLRDFMGRGMLGLASSCVPKCMPANSACKKGVTDQCLTKSHACMKCMKPGLLQLSDCVGINSTRLGLSNKLDLFATALRDGSTSEEGLPNFVNDLVLALNA